ncbi:hypothetical protein EDB92DRAFT_1895471 [Lactarius akahatsu]|uniref:Secreted protein n=1 Tax=Lactarius akahatsu TaxID=416441 RepID=A0AAD4L6F4_9AGAM|nr:hypothetical protein EDB92DRAFT_1895471 [Lactarius akahatsu]
MWHRCMARSSSSGFLSITLFLHRLPQLEGTIYLLPSHLLGRQVGRYHPVGHSAGTLSRAENSSPYSPWAPIGQ